jgi:DNA-binding SARP family transcriptional activator
MSGPYFNRRRRDSRVHIRFGGKVVGANSEAIRVELLGSPRAWYDGVEVPLGPPKQRAVLGLLANRVNDVVSVDQIVDAVWGEDAPKTCSNGVHTYVAGLRRVLEPGRGRGNTGAVLASTASGYSLKVDPECIDAEVFARRHGTARRLRAEGDLAGAVAELNPALHLWRGEAYAGVPGPFALVERTRLRDVRLTAIEEWAADMLSLYRHAEVIEVLTEAIVEEPLRERLPWLLMLGLYRCGRRAHALEAYRRTRVLLAEELGIEPGEQLSRLHERILASDPGLRSSLGEVGAGAVAAAHEVTDRRDLPGPAQLPPTARGFVGRQAECDALAEFLTREERRGATRIAVVHGIAGVGKRAFALELAHRLADRFPDGQLFVDLCGSSIQRAPMTAAEALGLMLVGLGVAEDQLPADVTNRAALYRSLLHGRRMLVVLDDVVGAEQVRSLIPPGPSGLIITSRRRQIELAVREGAHRVQLVPLSIEDSLDLFRCLVGPDRIDTQLDAAVRLARLCGRLPLALRVAAEALSASPRLPLAELADRYSDRRHRPDSLPPVAHLRPAGIGSFGMSATNVHAIAGDERLAEMSEADYPGFAHPRTHHPVEARITAPFRATAARELARLADIEAAPELPQGVLPFPASPWQHATAGPEPAAPPARPGMFRLEWTPVAAGSGTRPLVVAGDDRKLMELLMRSAAEDGVPAILVPGAGDERGWERALTVADIPPVVVLAMAAERLPDAGMDVVEPSSRMCAAVRTLVKIRPDVTVVVLTVGARGVLAGDRVVATSHSALAGLAPVLGLGFGGLFVGTVDLPVRYTAEDVRTLAGFLARGRHVDDVAAVRAGEVFAARLEAANTADTAFIVCADATYVVTGTLGAVGQAVVIDLVRRGARNLLLVGQQAETELGPEAAALLAAVRAVGLTVVYRDTGCNSAEAAAAACAGLVDLPPVRGVVHADGTTTFAIPAVAKTG